MELRILGAHNMESIETRMESHLIDGVLALDAGGLTRALTFEEQRQIRAIILSHRHFDHIRDLLPLGLALRGKTDAVELYAIEDTAEALRSTLLSGKLYPNFLENPSIESPTYRLNVVEYYQEFDVLGYTAVAVPVPHAVTAAGFQISDGAIKLFYTGDAGRGVEDAWKRVSPDVLLTEVTFGNENEESAINAGHLTPRFLTDALSKFQKLHGRLPRVIVSHMNPPWEEAIRRELSSVGEQFGIEITVSHSDMMLTL